MLGVGNVLRPGELFAGYRIVRALGAGGMGEVYLARDRDLPRLVALKLLTCTASGDRELRSRFEREANTIARLSHPNIVTIYARGEEIDQLWIAMAFIEGTDVARELDDARAMDPGRAVRIIAETADAIDYANDAGILHRDVKPANILLAAGTRERAVLTDFGIASSFEDGAQLTRTGEVLASFQYSAPERLDSSVIADRRADVYSLGCTLYQMLTGSLPYNGVNAAQLMAGHLNSPVPRPSWQNPSVPPRFDDVIARALAKNPADRFATCGELAAAAEHALNHRVTSRPGWSPLTDSGPPVGYAAAGPQHTGLSQSVHDSRPQPWSNPRPTRRPVRIAIGIVLLVTATIAAGGYGVSRLADSSSATAASDTSTPSTPATTTVKKDLRDDAKTDITPYTSIGLLAANFTDDRGAKFTLQTGGPPQNDTPPDCSHAGGTKVVEMLAEHGCSGMILGIYLEQTSPDGPPPVMVSVELFPLQDAATAKAAANDLTSDLQSDLVIWHPLTGPGNNVNNAGGNNPHRMAAYSVNHRYLITALAARTDLSQDPAIDPWLKSAARRATETCGPQ
ncbi:serine/threonine-protein kinase [Nocardia sp. NPDC051030]|uniref:serine/threonine-protein kinase n=1 Tax=Nocardia sp. NPDC051030 TaxID=3155162 RepID=UPI003446C8C0